MMGKKTKELILVDGKGRPIGYENEEKCHQGQGILHRAFTTLVFNDRGQVLIQRRSKLKKLWPLIWETSCSSHPRKGEKILPLAKKRLKEELNFTCPLKSIGKFQYQAAYSKPEVWYTGRTARYSEQNAQYTGRTARYKNSGSENEICSLLVGKYNGRVRRNPKEAADWKWVNFEELKRDVKKNPQKYAPWLKISLIFIHTKNKRSPVFCIDKN